MTTAPRDPLSRRAVPSPFRAIELREILRILNSKRAVLPEVAGFEIAAARDGVDHRRNHTQIRAVPRGDPGPVEFRYGMKLADSGCAGFADVAWDILGLAHRFHACGAHAPLGGDARRTVEPIVATAAGGLLPPRLAAVCVTYDFDHDEPHLTADLEMLGHDLALGIGRADGRDVPHLAREVSRMVERHREREAARVHARGARATGWITQAALRIIDAAGLDRRATIGLVQHDGEVGVTIGGPERGDLQADLFQIDGVIQGSVMPGDRAWHLRHEDLTIWGEGIPETLRGSLLGRSLGELFQNDELPADAVVASVEEVTSVDPEVDDDEVDGWLRLGIAMPIFEIDEATGEVREDRRGRKARCPEYGYGEAPVEPGSMFV